MSFEFTIPTQPPSVNHTYKIVRQYGRGGKPFMTLAKREEVLQYQLVASNIAKHARPPWWKPEGMIVIDFWFYLGEDQDCDNMMKALNDAFAQAWGINDTRFLPRAMGKTTGDKDPRVEVTVSG